MRRGCFSVLLLASALLFCAVPAGAQIITGALRGTVTDDTGAMLPGVTIELTGPWAPYSFTAVEPETPVGAADRHDSR